MAAEEVKALRRRLHATQRQFAGWFGLPTATVRHWERGNRQPQGAALVLLCVIRDNPRAVIQAVRKARRSGTAGLAEMERLESLRAPPGYGTEYEPVSGRTRRPK
jgi:DNA-binding XRE family transcriptional regulator